MLGFPVKAPRERPRGYALKSAALRSACLVFILSLVACFFIFPSESNASTGRNGGHNVIGSQNPSRRWYFAEGTTRAGFEEYICLLNPGSRPAEARFLYMLETGDNIEKTYDLPPARRLAVPVYHDVPIGHDVSCMIESSEPIVAERPIYFAYRTNCNGSHSSGGANSPKTKWYFAEGCTRSGFDTYLCVMNPNEVNAVIDICYLRSNAKTVTRRGIAIRAKSRMTIPVHNYELGIGRHDNEKGEAGVIVRSTNGVTTVVERTMYFTYSPTIDGGHNVVGKAAPQKKWYFAEGCTRSGFDTYLCIMNPGKKDALVEITYYTGNGKINKRRGIAVQGHSRITIAVHESEHGVGRQTGEAADVSIKVRSTNGVGLVVERPVYFSYQPFWNGGHCVFGAKKPSNDWFFAEGCTRHGFDTYLCLLNPLDKPAEIDLTYFRGDGSVEQKRTRVNRHSRKTVSVHGDIEGAGRGRCTRGDVGISVRSINGAGIVAERPVYFAPRWRTVERIALANARGWGEVTNGKPERKCLCLTFDTSNSGDIAVSISNILEANSVSATFFVTGDFPGKYPNAVRTIAEKGYEIGNHSMTHRQFTKISASRVSWELSSTDEAVKQATGISTKPYFRFPYGDRNSSLVALVNSLGYLSVYWTVDPQDWRAGRTPAKIASHVLSRATDGAIVLMHDTPATVNALQTIVDGLKARGFEIVTLTELLLGNW